MLEPTFQPPRHLSFPQTVPSLRQCYMKGREWEAALALCELSLVYRQDANNRTTAVGRRNSYPLDSTDDAPLAALPSPAVDYPSDTDSELHQTSCTLLHLARNDSSDTIPLDPDSPEAADASQIRSLEHSSHNIAAQPLPQDSSEDPQTPYAPVPNSVNSTVHAQECGDQGSEISFGTVVLRLNAPAKLKSSVSACKRASPPTPEPTRRSTRKRKESRLMIESRESQALEDSSRALPKNLRSHPCKHASVAAFC
ncbi:hypothetical protein PAAG_01839 [Paracoccidioides lutzii Pb01]|uniref:Uncharacterized protein n=1 Tax=Paracoccidioides lutzii (strain ATCC MYA-826 / Pb01) TaxID=502779 RepID=C1GTJ4_PARBA|nr:hypothetical protein PAAG_01839 [Paracoccidioides lutzii Pb01]EEH39650.2 hypothetical protein PAAG_01839 [Paracoccidioides lutzii Pb01]